MTILDPLSFGPTDGDDSNAARQLDPWRKPKTPAAEKFIKCITHVLEDHERQQGLRKRKRKAKDLETFECAVSALISDLTVSALSDRGLGLCLYRSNGKLKYGSRYRSPLTTKVVRDILNILCDPTVSLIEQNLGDGTPNAIGVQTVIWPTPAFCKLLSQHDLSVEDFIHVEIAEPIELKGEKEAHNRSAPRVEYSDDETTLRFREQMLSINRQLAEADLSYVGPDAIDTSSRQLRRIFTRNSFESGGRLYGGFWQQMRKADRLRYLRINGEPIVELDYGQIMPRLVYSLAGATPAIEDLYAIPGFEDHRAGVKRVMSSMLFVKKRMTKFPKGTRDLFPENVRVSAVVHAVMAAHPDIAQFFFKGIGHRCQFLESEIMVEVLSIILGMKSIGGVALPIHDAILVPASAQVVAARVMKHTFQCRTGLKAVVDVLTPDDLEKPLLVAA